MRGRRLALLWTLNAVLAIALGALFGSLVVDSIAVTGLLWLAAGLVVLTSLAVSAAPGRSAG